MATTDHEHEDFSFPATAPDSSPRFLDWPPLWQRSATTPRHERSKGKEVLEEEFRSSRSSKERSNTCATNFDEVGEEKMDLLWEDLNDEQLARNSGKFAENSEISTPRKGVIKALKLSKGNGQIVSGKKTSILVFIKVLKKVFLMHNSQRAIKKKQSW